MIVLANIAIIVGLVTALFDMGMNGSRYAQWAPFGLLMAFIGLSYVLIVEWLA